MDWSKAEIMQPATMLAFMAGIAPAVVEVERDIWQDAAVLRFLKTHKYEGCRSAKERDRIYRRAKAYRWMADSVFKLLRDGAMVVVPRASEREGIVIGTHRGMGHFGVQRVLDRLQRNYWWRGMGDTVVRVIRACHSCARVKVGFKESGTELQPLPVRGMGYRL